MDSFRFKRFSVEQGNCGMRVGTDGTLLGAWAQGGARILDIGTGTGLIALMMAQRFPQAQITAIDIDADAAQQAEENARQSPFADRISVIQASLQIFALDYAGPKFDAIVSNPPFFNDTKATGNIPRDIARHTLSLSYRDLFHHAAALLADSGTLSLVLPYSMRSEAFSEAAINGLRLLDVIDISTTPAKKPKRTLLSFSRHINRVGNRQTQCLSNKKGERSQWFATLTQDFYL